MLYRSVLRPILFRLPAETAHNLALHSLSLVPSLARLAGRAQTDIDLKIERFGLTFSNPVGLAAGFDKDGIALSGLEALGFGFIEGGTVTHHPQPGNPQPRLFRLPEDKALINRAGFNNQGAEAFARRASQYYLNCVLGISIGKSKVVPVEDAIGDYLKSFEAVFSVADYVAVNVSSPNTPRLRELQSPKQLNTLISALNQKNLELSAKSGRQKPLPLLIKLAPELRLQELESIVEMAERSGIAGIIATNTTVERECLRSLPEKLQAIGEGGLSGAPLRQRSTEVIAHLYKMTGGSLPLIGVGGIFTAAHAWEKISAGASLIQLYTGMIYEGPGMVHRIIEGLGTILKQEGFRSLEEAVGFRAGKQTSAGR